MVAKAIIVLCAQAVLIQGIYGQCVGNINNVIAAEELALAGNGLAYGSNLAGLSAAPGYPGSCGSYGLAANSFVPSSGGGFAVTSYSPISPTGITVISENAIEGALNVNGELPFLGAVVVEGALPTAGAGGIDYGCGSGSVAIVSEVAPAGPYGPVGPAAAGPAYPGASYGSAAGFGYGAGLGGRGYGGLGFGLGGCGCGGVY